MTPEAIAKIKVLIEEATKEYSTTDNLKTAAAATAAAALAAKKLGLLKGGSAALKGLGALKAGGSAALKGLGALKAGAGATMVDPSLSRTDAATKSMLASGGMTALVNAPAVIFGGLPGGALAIGSAAAAAQGGALGAALGGGRDTLTKSSLIPAATVAAAAPLTNMALEAGGFDEIGVDPTMSALITGGVGAGTWAARNWNKKKEII